MYLSKHIAAAIEIHAGETAESILDNEYSPSEMREVGDILAAEGANDLAEECYELANLAAAVDECLEG